jgi:hypothetical protein
MLTLVAMDIPLCKETCCEIKEKVRMQTDKNHLHLVPQCRLGSDRSSWSLQATLVTTWRQEATKAKLQEKS